MLLKFAYQEFLEDRKFKNTTEVNIKNYKVMLCEFVDLCEKDSLQNVEDITSHSVKQYLVSSQQRGNGPNTVNTKLQRIRLF
ncbi:phage integrase N-terminal SAM-like domain-containing protein [Bacillus inaquosorum]|nr:phage integrase N-terminal SAM-like domain-containing protein [Bacillus inaquosorum]MCY8147729.1 phage integrase N-terminal SAM-like domain-containing protein [Bacillus inaquosorum]MEC0575318.1 phage integrase N-terminal SAM-like domain-containing protein [Bacillus inaquosorum]